MASVINFDEDQVKAIEAGCDVTRRFVPITGKAGTGKTLIIKEIYDRLTAAGYKVALTAPTGKAAKRIRESTGIEAVTNHRLLGYGMPEDMEETDPETGEKTVLTVSTGPRYKRNNPLFYDVIIGDEYAMVNSTIHSELMAALKPGGRFIALGDENQLPPIEEGYRPPNAPRPESAFRTALTRMDGIYLNTVHRQSGDSGIAENCAMILDKKAPRSNGKDFIVKLTSQPIKDLLEIIADALDEGFDFTKPNCQIITPTNKTWVGVERVNACIQSHVFDNSKPYLSLPRHLVRKPRTANTRDTQQEIRVQEGTKVVYCANTYDMNDEHHSSVFNGEVGIVVDIDVEYGNVTIDFGDRVVEIPPLIVQTNESGKVTETDPRKNIQLAYALTTHKTQGSEYERVIVLLNNSSSFCQSRANFYTACSRARKHCTVISDQASLRRSVTVEK